MNTKERNALAYEQLKEIEGKYQELLLAVGSKFEGETRHETALRYIKESEGQTVGSRVALSIALRDCLRCFDDVLAANVAEERVETWRRVLDEHGLFDFPQCVSHDGAGKASLSPDVAASGMVSVSNPKPAGSSAMAASKTKA